MTLTIRTEEDDQRQLTLTVEVAEERVENAMRQTARKLARDINVPGFRRGKAPYNVLLRRVGREVLRNEAIEEIAPGIYEEALAQAGIEEVYGQSRLINVVDEPLVLTFVVPLPPIVELGDYRSIRKEVETVDISEEAVDEALEHIRTHHQLVETVERPAEVGDVVTLSGLGRFVSQEEDEAAGETQVAAAETELETAANAEDAGEGDDVEDERETAADAEDAGEDGDEEFDTVFFNEDSIELLMDSEKVFPGTPFVENIVGMSAGQQKSFNFAFPEDYNEEEWAGKSAEFDITVLEVKRRELPELNDELARQEGNYETLEELRLDLHSKLEAEARERIRGELLEGMVDDLLADASMVYPPSAVEMEIDDMVETFKSQVTRAGWQWDDYLRLQGTTEASLRENFHETATQRLERNLVLRQFILDEKLTIEAADIDAAVEERISQFEDAELQQGMRDYFLKGPGINMINNQILQDKVFERIEAILMGNAPDLDALSSAENREDGVKAEAAIDEEE